MIDFDNTIVKSFTANFCKTLEYHLSQTFRNTQDKRLRYFWCDGVRTPEASWQNWERFDETSEIITGAWFGENGQDEYEMIIRLGSVSFARCLKGLDLEECLPDDQTLDWIILDEQNRKIVLQLL
jgi:hypothetical protein